MKLTKSEIADLLVVVRDTISEGGNLDVPAPRLSVIYIKLKSMWEEAPHVI